MKKLISIILLVAMCLSLAACSDSKSNDNAKPLEPQVTQMKYICELATMQCYYHNVAKYFEKDASGALWWKKDRKFWTEHLPGSQHREKSIFFSFLYPSFIPPNNP